MRNINELLDLGYFDISEYKLETIKFLGTFLEIKLSSQNQQIDDLVVKMENVVAFDLFSEASTTGMVSQLRIDSEGGSYSHDVVIKTGNKAIETYWALYMFADKSHTIILFRGIAKSITLQ